MAVSLMFVILIAVYTIQELSTDQFQKNLDRMYVLARDGIPTVGLSTGYLLKNRYPEIEKVCPAVLSNLSEFQACYGDKKLLASSICVDSTFCNFFSFCLLEGDPGNALKDKYSAVISKSFAYKLFGQEYPMGKSIRISESASVIVSGVMEDIRNSVFPYRDILVCLERAEEFNSSIALNNDGNAGCTVAFIMLQEGVDLGSKIPDILFYFKEVFWIYKMKLL